MPVHDWTRVDAGIFHAFHQQWIISLSNALNDGVLPKDYYALPEQHAAGYGPDVLTLEASRNDDEDFAGASEGQTGLLVAPPKFQPTAKAELEFYRRKRSVVAVRHVSGDRIVAMIEIISPGNKSSQNALGTFLKTGAILNRHIHLLIVDLLPPGKRDPQGIHAAIWEYMAGGDYALPEDKPLTVAAYEATDSLLAFVRHLAVGQPLPEMPLFLEPDGCVQTPLEATYQTAFEAMPARWRNVLERM